MAENLSGTSGIQQAWDRAFARQDAAMGRTPAAAAPADDGPVAKARLDDLEGRVTALENPAQGTE